MDTGFFSSEEPPERGRQTSALYGGAPSLFPVRPIACSPDGTSRNVTAVARRASAAGSAIPGRFKRETKRAPLRSAALSHTSPRYRRGGATSSVPSRGRCESEPGARGTRAKVRAEGGGGERESRSRPQTCAPPARISRDSLSSDTPLPGMCRRDTANGQTRPRLCIYAGARRRAPLRSPGCHGNGPDHLGPERRYQGGWRAFSAAPREAEKLLKTLHFCGSSLSSDVDVSTCRPTAGGASAAAPAARINNSAVSSTAHCLFHSL
ncbi:hypothetical protein SKAU_G00402920 [Synaphobranchus kaupii]|uniref:Uncharacterized protein n=1 Tax=Synaphobranchus kaupii TaxID=118154 RepID=A0A9Q1E9D2_SYNKA|nr:hypothetical protein SKAU_G00402920 [Synaphobranchus kaupii]